MIGVHRLVARLTDCSTFFPGDRYDCSTVSLLEDDSGGSDTDPDQAFVKAVTEVVQKLLREEERKNAGAHVKMAAFEALQVCK